MERLYDDEEYRKSFKATVQREFRKINQFLRGLKDFTEKLPFEPVSLRVESFLNETLQTFRERAVLSGVMIDISVQPAELNLSIDPRSMGRALSNLFSNALDAMPHGGQLRIDVCQPTDDAAILTLRDSGPGFPPKVLENLFQDFLTTRSGGLGLGLTVVKRVIEQHHGTITLRNLEAGGAETVILLPMTQRDG
jgi:signal transduction histidine kinase